MFVLYSDCNVRFLYEEFVTLVFFFSLFFFFLGKSLSRDMRCKLAPAIISMCIFSSL